jgi:hypothetical protein
MLNNSNPLLSKAEWCRYCIHLTLAMLKWLKLYGIKSCGIDVPCNGITSLQNVTQIYQLVQKLLGGGDTYRHTHTHTHTHIQTIRLVI